MNMSEKVTREQMVAELQRLADELGHTPTMQEMEEHGEYSRGPYYREFGSWNATLEALNMKKNKRENITRGELLEAIHGLRDELGRIPTRDEMNEQGKFSRGPYDREFGGWNNALEAAGLDVQKPARLGREELLSELERLAAAIDRVPRQKDMNERGKYSERAYKREWENWNAALCAAGFEPNKPHDIEYPTLTCEWCGDEYKRRPAKAVNSNYCSKHCMAMGSENWMEAHPNAGERVSKECEWCGDEFEVRLSKKETARFCSRECLGKHHRDVRSGKDSPRWRGGYEPYYGPNWRKQRHRRRKEDDDTCQRCGATEDLVVHHKTPFREFVNGDTVDYEAAHDLDNLVTLCRDCHAYVENNAENGFGA